MRRHGCLLTYLLYLIIYLVYFVLIGKLLSSMATGIESDSLLALSLFLSFVLAALTSFGMVHGKRIVDFVRSRTTKS